MSVDRFLDGAERWQVTLYVAAIGAGAVFGLALPGSAPALSSAITPILAVLLFATFLAVPLVDVGRSLRDVRFLATVLLVNFLAVPVVVWALTRWVPDERGLLIGVLLVLLTPCVDYVIVFTGLAGGAKAQLLAATPLLMVLQILLLPLYLFLFAGADSLGLIDARPFVEAFLLLIVLPLAAAAVVQAAARRTSGGRTIAHGMARAMVPLMMATLAVVVASQVAAVGGEAGALLGVIPVYIGFLAVMVLIGWAAARVSGLGTAASRAVTFSGATRNSLVVLPLALALPPSLGLAPLAVVTQTLVELVGMVVLVRLVPKLLPGNSAGNSTGSSVGDAGTDRAPSAEGS